MNDDAASYIQQRWSKLSARELKQVHYVNIAKRTPTETNFTLIDGGFCVILIDRS